VWGKRCSGGPDAPGARPRPHAFARRPLALTG
jgi:hypothetical protein